MSRITSSMDSPGFFAPGQPELGPSTYSGTNPLALLQYIIHEFPSTSHVNNVHRFRVEYSAESHSIRRSCAAWVSNYPDPSLASDFYLRNNLTCLGNLIIQVSVARAGRRNRLSEWDSFLSALGLSGEMSIRYVEEDLVEIQAGTNRLNRQAAYLEAVLFRTIFSLHAYWGDGVHQYSNRGLELAHILFGLHYYLQQQGRPARRRRRRRDHNSFAARHARYAPVRLPEIEEIEYASEQV
jgi:hypothetical protein